MIHQKRIALDLVLELFAYWKQSCESMAGNDFSRQEMSVRVFQLSEKLVNLEKLPDRDSRLVKELIQEVARGYSVASLFAVALVAAVNKGPLDQSRLLNFLVPLHNKLKTSLQTAQPLKEPLFATTANELDFQVYAAILKLFSRQTSAELFDMMVGFQRSKNIFFRLGHYWKEVSVGCPGLLEDLSLHNARLARELRVERELALRSSEKPT